MLYLTRTTTQLLPNQVKPHHCRIIVHIYALSQAAVTAVIDDIEKLIRAYLVDKVMDKPRDEEFISKLTEDQVKRILDLQKVYSVKITIERGPRVKRIRIQGPPESVISAMDHINQIFIEVKHQEHQDFVGKLAQWEYLDNTDYEPYPDEINNLIENAYTDKKHFAEWEEQNARYRLTFATMEEEMVGDASSKVKVRRNAREVTVPSHWTAMTLNENVTKVVLDPTSTEFKDVENNVKTSCHTTMKQIIQIERIQNPSLYKQYFIRKSEMEKTNPTVQSERRLWHGTSVETVPSINSTGFNRSYCGKNATVYGRGVYFARDFSYSGSNTYSPPDDKGIKYVYQSLVLTGEFCAGAQSMIVPPSKPGGGRFDSVVDSIASPTIFVIFYDTQAYPEYLVSFN
jgi:poly [ADP-ribose] polymerase 10/14/15